MESTKVILDCDFLQGILNNTSVDFLKQLMSELHVKPVVHEYVAEVELKYCSEAQELIKDGYIEKIEYSQYLHSDYDRKIYNEMVWELLENHGKGENGLAWKDIKAVLREKRWHEEREKLWQMWNAK